MNSARRLTSASWVAAALLLGGCTIMRKPPPAPPPPVVEVAEQPVWYSTASGEDIDALKTIAGFATNLLGGPAGEGSQTLVEFEVVSNSDPSLFDVQPSIDPLTGNILFALYLIFIAVQMALKAWRARRR